MKDNIYEKLKKRRITTKAQPKDDEPEQFASPSVR